MKKNVLAVLLGIAVMALTMTACGGDEEIPVTAVKPIEGEYVDHQAIEESKAQEEAKKVDYTIYSGLYNDSTSKRAIATVVGNGTENAEIVVSWSTSVAERNQWTMHVTKDEDGRLQYKDCKLELLSVNAEGEETGPVLYDDGVGYFEVVDGNLLWTGSAEESTKGCVFEKLDFEENQ